MELPPLESSGVPVASKDAGAHLFKRVREVVVQNRTAETADIGALVTDLASKDCAVVKKSLDTLSHLTCIDHDACDANQNAFMALNGVQELFNIVEKRLSPKPVTDSSYEEVVMVLLTLENLSCSPSLHASLALKPDGLQTLIMLMDRTQIPLVINATKVLANITYLMPRLQRVVTAHKADAAAIKLLYHPDEKCAVQGAWLLANLTMNDGSKARDTVCNTEGAAAKLKQLLKHTNDLLVEKVAYVICHTAKAGPEHQQALLSARVVPGLVALLDSGGSGARAPEVTAAALSALATLALGGSSPQAAQQMLADTGFARRLQAVLDSSTIITADYAVSHTLAAAHALVLALAHMVLKHGLKAPAAASSSGSSAAVHGSNGSDAAVSSLESSLQQLQLGPGGSTRHSGIQNMIKESHFTTLSRAAQLVGVVLPAYNTAMLFKTALGVQETAPNSNGNGNGSTAQLGAAAQATMGHMLNKELLPLLSDDSAHTVMHACARVQQMAVCLAEFPEYHAMLCSAGLLTALMRLLSACEHSLVRQAALSCLAGGRHCC